MSRPSARGPAVAVAVAVAAFLAVAAVAVVALAPQAAALVVNENTDNLPPGCDAVAGDVELTAHGGRDHVGHFHGAAFTFDNRSFDVPACTRVTVTFVNDDDIRHQFMVHGTYPDGFFIIEVDGPGRDTGTFITGAEPSTLMVHCGLPQHQQKGMKAQVLVAGGVGDLPNILGVSGVPGDADAAATGARAVASAPLHAAVALVFAAVAFTRRGRR